MRALVAIDLEERADTSLAKARPLLARLGATLDLLHVEPLVVPIGLEEDRPDLDRLVEGAIERRLERLRARLAALVEDWPREQRGEVRVERHARPADAIVARAEGHDLIVVGTHGRTGLARVWLGSVAEKVVRASPVPVLVSRPAGPAADAGRVLLAVDAFEEGTRALVREATPWAARLQAVVDLVHVVAPLAPLASGDRAPRWASPPAEVEQAAAQRLDTVAHELPSAVRGSVRVLRGAPAEELARLSPGYALTMVGTRRRGGLEAFWLGSVAERLVRLAEGPVLVLRVSRGVPGVVPA